MICEIVPIPEKTLFLLEIIKHLVEFQVPAIVDTSTSGGRMSVFKFQVFSSFKFQVSSFKFSSFKLIPRHLGVECQFEKEATRVNTRHVLDLVCTYS